MRKFVKIFAASLALGQALAKTPTEVLYEVEGLIVQEGGRKKPFVTFAQEELTLLHGKASWKDPKTQEHWSAVHLFLDIWVSPDRWVDRPLVLLEYERLKAECGLDLRKRYFSYNELIAAQRLWQIVEESNRLRKRDQNAKITALQQKALETAKKIEVLNGLLSGDAYRVVPHPEGASLTWGTLEQLPVWYGSKGSEVLAKAKKFLSAVQQGNPTAEQVVVLKEELKRLRPEFFPSEIVVLCELAYVRWHPFRLAWICLGIGFATMVLCRLLQPPWVYRIGLLVCILAFTLLVWGALSRIIIAGRAPVTNMYETVVWLALGVVVFALAFALRHQSGVHFWVSFPVAMVALLLADTFPVVLNPSIEPLVAVLRSNFWLTVHVMTIVTSYSAFAVSMALAHVLIWKLALSSDRGGTKSLTKYVVESMQLGVWLLGTGIVLGGVWANYSWGRFWDWDPKETFSLVALLGYLVTLHGRRFGFWKDVGVATGCILSFQLVLFAWYGVNFILASGLHSYGFGSGNDVWFYVFVAAELTYVTVTAFLARFRAHQPKMS